MADALIWGASGGIGRALTAQLASAGWRVFGAARDESRVPVSAFWRGVFDASDDHSFDATAYAVGLEAEDLRLVVYAAGVMLATPLESISSADWQLTHDVNLRGALRAIQASLPLLAEGGQIVVIGAKVDRLALPKFGAYAAAKAGLEPLLAVLAKEHRRLKFTLVRPGAVDTPFWDNVPFKLPAGAESAETVAAAILAHVEAGQGGILDL
ncbi:MAG TPA: SDR family NAD(P)-dependent oxidoreductase [Candidatus Limnocylindrales bacterium]|nr:SDR family NAD(P)-dependent oxidoreductase [Candidatus Limnocylindrales bacterium]